MLNRKTLLELTYAINQAHGEGISEISQFSKKDLKELACVLADHSSDLGLALDDGRLYVYSLELFNEFTQIKG